MQAPPTTPCAFYWGPSVVPAGRAHLAFSFGRGCIGRLGTGDEAARLQPVTVAVGAPRGGAHQPPTTPTMDTGFVATAVARDHTVLLRGEEGRGGGHERAASFFLLLF